MSEHKNIISIIPVAPYPEPPKRNEQQQISSANQRDMFRVVNRLTSPNSDSTLPNDCDPKHLVNRFADYFHLKVRNLMVDNDSHAVVEPSSSSSCTSLFKGFQEVTEHDVLKVINSSTVTSCFLDPLPAHVFKECVSELLPVITKIVNLSIISGHVPNSLKQDVIIPHIKKPQLDTENLANYRHNIKSTIHS